MQVEKDGRSKSRPGAPPPCRGFSSQQEGVDEGSKSEPGALHHLEVSEVERK